MGLRSSPMTDTGAPSPQADALPGWLNRLWHDHPVAVLMGIAILALAVTISLIWPITDLIAAHDVGLATASQRPAALSTAREAVRTQLLTLGAGVFAAGALVYTARNFSLSRGTLEETRRTVDLTRQTLELSEQGQVTDRYTKAVEQLGSSALGVRVGGIYALERIARDSVKDHPTVMEVLASFVRGDSRTQQAPNDIETFPVSERLDVQSAVIVIGRRDVTRDLRQINLVRSDLTGMDLSGANLANVNLYKSRLIHTILKDADLTGAMLSEADMRHAYLLGAAAVGADFSNCLLSDALVAGADLSKANLSQADIRRANLTVAIEEPGGSLRRTNLTGADLSGSDLREADLREALFSVTGHEATVFSGANLDGAIMSAGVIPEGWVQESKSDRVTRAR
jgi:uncharacterized protein YjbI with pentapeptide repeats